MRLLKSHAISHRCDFFKYCFSTDWLLDSLFCCVHLCCTSPWRRLCVLDCEENYVCSSNIIIVQGLLSTTIGNYIECMPCLPVWHKKSVGFIFLSKFFAWKLLHVCTVFSIRNLSALYVFRSSLHACLWEFTCAMSWTTTPVPRRWIYRKL